LKLTTAKFYSPQNRPYSEQGVEPDVLVRLAARPAGADDSELAAEFGDPAHDPVLAKAIEAVRRQLTSFR
jgi:carboxyl-terminal processing protease